MRSLFRKGLQIGLLAISIHASICFKFVTDQNAQSQSKKKCKPLPSDETENNRAVKLIQYTISRGKTIDYVLQFPILSRSIFLLEKDKLFTKKSKKADLMNFLLENLNNCDNSW